jgi:hypothetical protein
MSYHLFEIVFKGLKNAFNTQKICLKKKYSFDKKIKSAFENLKSLKNDQSTLLAKLKNETFA